MKRWVYSEKWAITLLYYFIWKPNPDFQCPINIILEFLCRTKKLKVYNTSFSWVPLKYISWKKCIIINILIYLHFIISLSLFHAPTLQMCRMERVNIWDTRETLCTVGALKGFTRFTFYLSLSGCVPQQPQCRQHTDTLILSRQILIIQPSLQNYSMLFSTLLMFQECKFHFKFWIKEAMNWSGFFADLHLNWF